MKRRIHSLGCAILLAGSAGMAAAQDEIRSELERRTSETRAKISDLFDQRDNPIPVVDANLNPFFRVAGFVPEPTAEGPDEEAVFVPPPRKEADLLEAIAASLRINGIVTYNNRDLIVINQTPTPAGRMISVDFEGKTYFVRVEEIFSNRVVLSLGSVFTILPIAIEPESGEGRITPGTPPPDLD